MISAMRNAILLDDDPVATAYPIQPHLQMADGGKRQGRESVYEEAIQV
jgi:hypothetical protein